VTQHPDSPAGATGAHRAGSGTEGRLRVLVLFGGRSSEHPISCITASGVLQAMDPACYEVVPVGITTTGQWTGLGADPRAWDLPGGDLPHVPEPADPLSLHLRQDGTHELVSATSGASHGPIDVVFPLVHGPFGEDGTLQGQLEMAAVPYVGAGVLASAVGMDKHFMKIAFQAAGLRVGPWETITDRQWLADRAAAMERVSALGFPLFVKPARAGSSFGITRVAGPEGLEAAIEEARRFDPKVVVEAGIVGREIECAVLDGRGVQSPRASLPGEIVVHDGSSHHEFYDFQAKYQDNTAADLSCPADLPQEAIAAVQRQAVLAFDAVDAEGLSRVDFFYTPEGEFVVNEINTMPGFTPISMYPSMWERSGLDYGSLIDELIILALERGTGLH
jgi:D-alanine-D-alanine ligase